jgi:hypothetical protein
MAGLKVWNDPDILYSADINTYLMGQAIPRFASTAARDAAITAPVEGMFAYITGTGLTRYTGSAWTFNAGESGKATLSFTADARIAVAVTFAHPFAVAPVVVCTPQIGSFDDILYNHTSAPTTTGFAGTCWQAGGTPITETGYLHWIALRP